MVELVSEKNRGEVETFLSAHEESAQFLITNLRDNGAKLTEHHNSGNFKAIKINDVVVAVFCLSRRGNLIIQSEVCEPKMILDACASESVVLKGFIGEWNSVEPVYNLYKEINPSYLPSYESKEILYSYPLSSNDTKIAHDKRVRLITDDDYSQWSEFSNAYLSELSLPDELSEEQKRQDFESKIAKRIFWGLFDSKKLLSRTALNSNGEKIGQVGGVFTPKAYRQQGFAKAVMFHMLKDCRDLHGHTKNILFTGESDIPAQKLYESMGYARIGSFALVLG